MILETTLSVLESSDLVRRLREDERTYLFKHVLVQDAAQESLLKNERKRLNELVARALEELYTEQLDEFAARLYQHYDAAGVDAKAFEYAERAGNVALRLCAYDEALMAYTRAFELAREHRYETASQTRLMTRLGRVYELKTRYDDALELYQTMRDQAHKSGDRALELAALVQLATVFALGSIKYDPRQSQEIAQEALNLASALNDQHAEAKILWTMMLGNLYGAGGAKASVVYGERSLALARALNWREQIAYTLNDLFYTYLNLGELTRARQSAAEACTLWLELDDKPMLTDNLNAEAMLHLMNGELNPTLALLQQSLAVCQAIGNPWGEVTAYMVQGTCYQEHGYFARAQTSFEACIECGDAIGIKGQSVMARFGLARIFTYLGDIEHARLVANDALERTTSYALDWNTWAYAILGDVEFMGGDWIAAERARQEIGNAPPEHFFERMLPVGALQVVQAQIQYELGHGNLETAKSRLEQLLNYLRRSQFQIFLPPTLNELARLLISKGEVAKGREALDEAQEIADALDLNAARYEIAVTRMDLETLEGDGNAAADQAKQELGALLALVPAELRESFLKTPSAQSVLKHA